MSCRFGDRSPLIVQSIAISPTRPSKLQSFEIIFSQLRIQQPGIARDTSPNWFTGSSAPESCRRILDPRIVFDASHSLDRP